MNIESASRQTTMNKRVRFKSEPTTPVSSAINTPPVKVALESVRAFSSTLHVSLAPVVKDIGEKHVSLFKNLHRKKKSFDKLKSNVETIPQSVNVLQDFKLRASNMTENTEEFASVSEDTTDIISTFRVSMKNQIMRILNLEIQDLREKYHRHYIAAIRQLAEAEFLSITAEEKIDFHSKVSILFESDHDFFTNIDIGYDVFCEKYKETHGLAIFPQPSGSIEDANQLLHKSQELKRIFQGTLVDPISSYL